MASKGPARSSRDPNTRVVAKGIFGLSGHGEIITDKLIYQDNRYISQLLTPSVDGLPDLRVLSFADFGTCAFEYGTENKFKEIAVLTQQNPDKSTWELLNEIRSTLKGTVMGEVTSEELAHRTKLSKIEIAIEALMEQSREIVNELESNPDDPSLINLLEENQERLIKLNNTETFTGFSMEDASNALKGNILEITCPHYDKDITIRGTDDVYYSLQIFDIRYPDGYDGDMLEAGEVISNGIIMEPYLKLFNKIIADNVGPISHFLSKFLLDIESETIMLSSLITLFAMFGIEVQNWVDTTCNEPDRRVSERDKRRIVRSGVILKPLEMYYGRKLTHAGTKKKRFKKKKSKKSKKKKTKRKRQLN